MLNEGRKISRKKSDNLSIPSVNPMYKLKTVQPKNQV